MPKFRTIRNLSFPEPELLIIKVNLFRKIIYAVSILAIFIAFFIGFNISLSLPWYIMPEIIVYFIITIALFTYIAFSKTYIIEKKIKKLSQHLYFFSVSITNREVLRFTHDNVAINLIGIPLFDNYPMDKTTALRQNHSGSKKGSRSSIFKKRFILYRLFVDNPDTRIKLFETTDYKEAQRIAEIIGEFLEITVFESSW